MFKHLLVPLDGSTLAECVLPHTIAFARTFDAHVTLLHVIPTSHSETSPTIPMDVMDWRMMHAEADSYLGGVADHLRRAGVQVEPVVTQGEPARSIVDAIHSYGTNLVVLSSHGESGLTGWNIGSVVQKVLLHTPVSSLLVRAYQPIDTRQTNLHYGRLLVPLDGSLRSECVLPAATRLAKVNDAELLLTHIVQRPEAPRCVPLSTEDRALVQRLAARNRAAAATHLEWLASHLSVPAELHILERTDVPGALHGVVQEEAVDLVVMSAHGYSGRTRWPYGQVTANFVVYGEAPLLLVQDLATIERQPSAAEAAAQEGGGHRYMPKERFLEPAH